MWEDARPWRMSLSAWWDRNGAPRSHRLDTSSTALISCRTNLSPFTKDCRVLRASNVSFLIFARSLPPTKSNVHGTKYAPTTRLVVVIGWENCCCWETCCCRCCYCCWEQRKDAGSRDQKFCCKLRHRRTYRSHRRQSAVTCSADPEPP